MSVTLHLTQDGDPHDEESKKLTLFIDDEDSPMKVYVPRNNDDQEYTFTKLLAKELFESMMSCKVREMSERVGRDGVNATRDVLLAPRRRIGAALDDNGIGAIDIDNLDEVPPEPETPQTPTRPRDADIVHGSAPSDTEESDATILVTPASSAARPTSDLDYEYVVPGRADLARSSISLPTRRNREGLTLSSPSPTPPPARPEQDANTIDERSYVQLLDKVVSAAKRHRLPRYGTGGMSQGQVNMSDLDTYGERDYFDLSSISQFVRNCKVGAAGELYVSSPNYYAVSFPVSRLIAAFRFSNYSISCSSPANSLASQMKTG